jgi:hypothetical protein
MKKHLKKLKIGSFKDMRLPMLIFVCAFAVIGGLIILRSQAAPGACSTTGVVGTANYTISVPETAQYRVWVRMQVPDTTNTGNTNGVRLELAGNQCFTVTTTNSAAVNQWQWINYDATASTTPLVTSQLTTGSINAKIYGLKAGVKVDKVILLKSDNTCVPSNDFNNGSPGDNCTTPVPTVTINTTAASILSGTSTTINWTSTNATGCTASGGWTGAKTTSGSQSTGNLTANTTYTLTCTGVGGSGSNSTTVTVTAPPAPTVNLAANPATVASGSSSILSWSSSNATSCTASGGWTGAKTTSGSQSTALLTTTTTFTLACTGAGGTTSRSVTVTVTAAPPPTDTTAPTVVMTIVGETVTPTTTAINVINQRGVRWQPLATDDSSGIKTLVLTVNDQPVTLTAGEVGVGQAVNGNYVLKAVATDNANNVTTVTLTVRVRHPDFNRSGRVDLFDLSLLLGRWNLTSDQYDINVNNVVDLVDLSILLNRWNSTL